MGGGRERERVRKHLPAHVPAILAEVRTREGEGRVREGEERKGEGGESVRKHLPAHVPAILAEVRTGERGRGKRGRGRGERVLENIYLHMCLLYWLR